MLCKNTSKEVARFRIDGQPGESRGYAVPPSGTVEIPDGYCRSYVSTARKPMKPLITQVHSAMIPLPGQYAPGMGPETHLHGKDIPSAAAQQIEALASMVAQLSAQVAALSGQPVASPTYGTPDPLAANPAPVEVDPPSAVGEFDPDDTEVAALVKQSKADLLSLAREMGARAEEKMTKAQLAEAILEARNAPGDE